MRKWRKWLLYFGFFGLLTGGFLFFVYNWAFTDEMRNQKTHLKVINNKIPDFQFTDQNNRSFSKKQTEGRIYVAEYFFTTCKGICPKMNANMRRVYDQFKDTEDFLIASHTCQPEVDSIPLLKDYEQRMIGGQLIKKEDGSFSVETKSENSGNVVQNKNWYFLTGNKAALYDLARTGYIIDKNDADVSQPVENQFIHTQFFALVDRYGRVRGIYDGLKNKEVDQLMIDIKDLLSEKIDHTRFLNGFSNTPN